MEFLSIVEIWKYLRWLPSFVLKRIFNRERMADLILVDVRPRYSSVTANLGEIPTFEVWLQVINLSPFELTLKQAEIELQCAGVSLNRNDIKRQVFKPGQVSSIFFKGDIGSGKADTIARLCRQNDSSISVHFEMGCFLHDFRKKRSYLEGVHVSYLNVDYRGD